MNRVTISNREIIDSFIPKTFVINKLIEFGVPIEITKKRIMSEYSNEEIKINCNLKIYDDLKNQCRVFEWN